MIQLAVTWQLIVVWPVIVGRDQVNFFFIGKQAASIKLEEVLERKGMNGLMPKTSFQHKLCLYLIINVAVFLEFF